MIVHLVDGTYELFRHFYGARRGTQGEDPPFGAVIGVLGTVLQLLETGATHVGVATDHVIESFRNHLWADYKTGDGIEPALWKQFHPLEEALTAMGVVVWAMVELEADDALASAAHIAAADGYPGIPGIGAVTAARLLNEHGAIESFPPAVLGEKRDDALLFKKLATLRTDAPLFQEVDELRWRGPTTGFGAWTQQIGAPRLLERSRKAYAPSVKKNVAP